MTIQLSPVKLLKSFNKGVNTLDNVVLINWQFVYSVIALFLTVNRFIYFYYIFSFIHVFIYLFFVTHM